MFPGTIPCASRCWKLCCSKQSSEVNYVLVAAGFAGKQTSVVSLEQSHPTANGECQKASLNYPLSLLSQFHYFDSFVFQKFTTFPS